MREKSRGGCTLVGAELNDRIALGARVALVHVSLCRKKVLFPDFRRLRKP